MILEKDEITQIMESKALEGITLLNTKHLHGEIEQWMFHWGIHLLDWSIKIDWFNEVVQNMGLSDPLEKGIVNEAIQKVLSIHRCRKNVDRFDDEQLRRYFLNKKKYINYWRSTSSLVNFDGETTPKELDLFLLGLRLIVPNEKKEEIHDEYERLLWKFEHDRIDLAEFLVNAKNLARSV